MPMIGLAVILAVSLTLVPLGTAEAQPAGKVWRIGYMTTVSRPEPGSNSIIDAFTQRMRELGYVEGQNLVIEWRQTHGRKEEWTEAAAELVRLKLDVIMVPSTQPALAARELTTTPIV